MAIAQRSTASLAVEIPGSNQSFVHSLWNPFHFGVISLTRLWWHTRAYSTIIGVILLAAVSLVFLQLHWVLHRLWKTSGSLNSEYSQPHS